LSHEGLREMSELRREYLSALSKIGFGMSDTKATAEVDEERKSRQLLKAVLIAGLYPRVVRVRRTRVRYMETASGAVLAEPDATDLMFIDESTRQRVFVHPGMLFPYWIASTSHVLFVLTDVRGDVGSVLFQQRVFTFPLLVYGEKVMTTKMYVRDVTCVAPYGFLLFGGSIRVEHASGVVFVDNKFKVGCSFFFKFLVHVNANGTPNSLKAGRASVCSSRSFGTCLMLCWRPRFPTPRWM